jgi:hypothetical protein
MRAIAQQTSGTLRERVVIRAAVALLYAHWEGFVKKSSTYYLEYVASHRLRYEELAPNFVALALRSRFSQLSASRKLSGANDLAAFFCTSLGSRSNVPYKNVVDTKSNLSSTVLLDILAALGLDDAQFLTRLKFIDGNLVDPRNHIAHGEGLVLPIPEYLKLHDDVMVLIETYRNLIENAALTKAFARDSSSVSTCAAG